MAHDHRDVPYEEAHGLWPNPAPNVPTPASVPGQPGILSRDRAAVSEFLRRELSTNRLEKMYWMLFLVSNKRNISPLHHQAVKGRQIIVAERPDLHLVWYHDRIFMKPIPVCLLDYAFYRTFLVGQDADPQLHLDACGFLRTYTSLIVHETDFKVAKQSGLIPENISWEAWCRFASHLQHRRDADVSRRYHYGELRLTRLNFYSKIFFYGWNYLEVYHQYVEYFTRFMGPYLFIFGAIAVILAALQTAVTADTESVYKSAVFGFCTFSIALTVAGLAFFPLLYLVFQLTELLLFIFRHREAT